MRKAFTLIELMVAVGILAIILSFAGVIFNASIDTHRTALANAEIMQKLRAITNQLDADFQGLCKDGEIFVAWVAVDRRPDYTDCDLDGFERFDRIMFFADGDFQSYRANPAVRGNLARICYSLAKKAGLKPAAQNPSSRMLARTQHIITADTGLPDFFTPSSFTDSDWYLWNNWYEYDKISLEQWKKMPFVDKKDALSVIADVKVFVPSVGDTFLGANVDTADANSIHMLLCEGVAEFKVQGWFYDSRLKRFRWITEVDPDGDGFLTDTDFIPHPTDPQLLHPDDVPGVLYPYRVSVPPEAYGGVQINGINYQPNFLSEANFNNIPGLGRALKFTFKLFDSKGIIERGRTFTHIVYLDK